MGDLSKYCPSIEHTYYTELFLLSESLEIKASSNPDKTIL